MIAMIKTNPQNMKAHASTFASGKGLLLSLTTGLIFFGLYWDGDGVSGGNT